MSIAFVRIDMQFLEPSAALKEKKMHFFVYILSLHERLMCLAFALFSRVVIVRLQFLNHLDSTVPFRQCSMRIAYVGFCLIFRFVLISICIS